MDVWGVSAFGRLESRCGIRTSFQGTDAFIWGRRLGVLWLGLVLPVSSHLKNYFPDFSTVAACVELSLGDGLLSGCSAMVRLMAPQEVTFQDTWPSHSEFVTRTGNTCGSTHLCGVGVTAQGWDEEDVAFSWKNNLSTLQQCGRYREHFSPEPFESMS